MTRLAPLVERTDNSSHQYSCVDRAHEPDDIEAALRRQPAQTCPSARQSPLPFQRKTTFWSRLIAASASSTSPRAWPGLHVGRYPRPRGLCASLFVFIAVKSVVPMWPVWFHCVADVIALVTA